MHFIYKEVDHLHFFGPGPRSGFDIFHYQISIQQPQYLEDLSLVLALSRLDIIVF